jgi:hypothetical protein
VTGRGRRQGLDVCTARGHGCAGTRLPRGRVRDGDGCLTAWVWVCEACDSMPGTPGPYRVRLREDRA